MVVKLKFLIIKKADNDILIRIGAISPIPILPTPISPTNSIIVPFRLLIV